MIVQYKNGQLIRNGGLYREDLWVQDGYIIPPSSNVDQVVDLQGHYLAPGYIDLQMNGGFGVDFSTSLEHVEHVAQSLLAYGVTSFLPTLVSSSPTYYHSQLALFRPLRQHFPMATALGLHLEGPFLNPKQNGAHASSAIKNFEEVSLESMYENFEHVKMVTLAPEIPGALEAIQNLQKRGIIVSAGHSEANDQEFLKGVKNGIRAVTHLFNAMPSFHHRNKGILSEALADPEIFFSLICDGVHLNQRAIQMAWKINPRGLFLVSDAISLFGTDTHTAHQGGVEIFLENRKAYVSETGRLAGGLVGLDSHVRNLLTNTGCSIPYAIEAASTRPAKLLGIDSQRGTLNVGSIADMVVLNEKLEVLSTYVKGERGWNKT